VKDVLGEANDHQYLGQVSMWRGELDEAEKTFECALELHHQVKMFSVKGMTLKCWESSGNIRLLARDENGEEIKK
jgi:hypothetical protein